MGYTDDYLIWLTEKYGREDEDLEDLLERLGDEAASFGWMREFALDTLAEVVERNRDQPARWDAFISYAGEHKDSVAAPLSSELRKAGLTVWLDLHEYPRGTEWNGILYRYVHEGIARSRLGVAIISPHYVMKDWTTQEYFGLRLKGYDRLFVVLHEIEDTSLEPFDPALAARIAQAPRSVAWTAKSSFPEIAEQIRQFSAGIPK